MSATVVLPQVGSTRITRFTKEVNGVASAYRGRWPIFRNTGGAGLSPNISTVESEELTGSSVLGLRNVIRTQTLGNGNYGFEVSPRANSFTYTPGQIAITDTNLIFSSATLPTVVSDNPKAWQVTIANSTTSANNGTYTIKTTANSPADTLVVEGFPLTVQSAQVGMTLIFNQVDSFSTLLEAFFQNDFDGMGRLYPGTKDISISCDDYFSDVTQELLLGGCKPDSLTLNIASGQVVKGDVALQGSSFHATRNYVGPDITQAAQSVVYTSAGGLIQPTLPIPAAVVANPTAFVVTITSGSVTQQNNRTYNITGVLANNNLTVSATPNMTSGTSTGTVLTYSGKPVQTIYFLDNGDGTSEIEGLITEPPSHITGSLGAKKYYIQVNSDTTDFTNDGYYEIISATSAYTIRSAESVNFTASTSTIVPTTAAPSDIVTNPRKYRAIIRGATNANNNGSFTVATAASTTSITLNGSLTNETGSSVTILWLKTDVTVKGTVAAIGFYSKTVLFTEAATYDLLTGNPPTPNTSQPFVAGDLVAVEINPTADGNYAHYQDTANYGLLFSDLSVSGKLTTSQLLEVTNTNPFAILPTDRRITLTFTYHFINTSPLCYLMGDTEFGIRFKLTGTNGNYYMFEFPRCKSKNTTTGDAKMASAMAGKWEVEALLTDTDIVPPVEHTSGSYGNITSPVNAIVYRSL